MEKFQTFHQSVNPFPVETEEDKQNERLRKIHTFQASFDDFVAYVNQRIKDTKIQENNNVNILDFENYMLSESIKPYLVTESVQSSIIRNLLTAIDTSNNSKFTSFISIFKGGNAYGQLAWDQIQDIDFETYIVNGTYPSHLGWNEKFNTRSIVDEDKKMVSALKKAMKNAGLSIYMKDDIVKAVSLGSYWYIFDATTEVDHDDPRLKAAKAEEDKVRDAYYSKSEEERKGTHLWNDPEYIEAEKKVDAAQKAATRNVNRWLQRKAEDLNEGVWAQVLVYWGVNKICILQDTQKYNIQNLQKERRASRRGMIDLTPEGLAKIASENMERYKKIVAQKKANSDDAFAKQDQMFMDTIMEGMKTLNDIRSSREKILTKGSLISRAVDILDTLMGLYSRFVSDSNRYVEELARYQQRGKDYEEWYGSERKYMEKSIEQFKEYKAEFDGYIAKINADD